jgi:hypothetical protein
MPFRNQECVIYVFLLAGFDAVGLADRICPDEHGETEAAYEVRAQPGTRVGAEGNFLFFPL